MLDSYYSRRHFFPQKIRCDILSKLSLGENTNFSYADFTQRVVKVRDFALCRINLKVNIKDFVIENKIPNCQMSFNFL